MDKQDITEDVQKKSADIQAQQEELQTKDSKENNTSVGIWSRIKNWLMQLFGFQQKNFFSITVKTFSIPDLIVEIKTWIKLLSGKYGFDVVSVVTIPAKVMKDLVADAQSNANPEMKMKYGRLGELLLSNSTDQDIVALAQNSQGDVIASALFSAENYERQADDARDYTMAVNRNGNILKKIEIT
ncbi:MAG: hypothetical protein IJF84_04355 [Thermoguttaceae bacterium]|nr:hypothetical protein [Thermoguttaceae bacterium]